MKYECPYCQNELDEQNFCKNCDWDFSREVSASQRGELIPWQIEASDELDNACHDLIKRFNPDAEWDSEDYGAIKDALVRVLVDKYGFKEFDLDPWILESVTEPAESVDKSPYVEVESESTVNVVVRTELTEKDEEGHRPIEVTVSVSPDLVEVKVPSVEVFSDASGHGIPIMIEQSHGKLRLLAYDKESEEPVVDYSWPKKLAKAA